MEFQIKVIILLITRSTLRNIGGLVDSRMYTDELS